MGPIKTLVTGALLAAAGEPVTLADPATGLDLRGTWEMDQAYEVLADGTRVTGYGEHPAGRLTIDGEGRYSLQIFRRDRPRFAAGEKGKGTAEELRLAVMGSSTHFGRVHLDRDRRQLVFDVEAASFPNWEGKRQVRDYSYAHGLLRYAVPASASGNGTIAHSVWRKAG